MADGTAGVGGALPDSRRPPGGLAAASARPYGCPASWDGSDDLGEAERALRFYDPACEIHVGAGWPLDGEPVYHGYAGWLAAIRLWEQAATLSFVAKEMLDMGGLCFTVLMTVSLTGTESGASAPPVQAVWTYTLRRGLVMRLDMRHDGWDVAPAELAAALRRLTPATEKPSSTPA